MQMAVYNSVATQKQIENLFEMHSHNLTNAGTPGTFARAAHLVGYTKGVGTVTYTQNGGFFNKIQQGPLEHTGNPLDIGFNQPTFLAVETEQGEAYTKNGHLTLGPEGQLQTATGYTVLGDGGPISIPPTAEKIYISTNGTISMQQGTQNTPIGQLRLVHINKAEKTLTPITGNLFLTDKENVVENPPNVLVKQYFITGSNIEPTQELTQIMRLHDQYRKTMSLVDHVSHLNNDETENLLSLLPV